MDDFRAHLESAVDGVLAQGLKPVFLVVELGGAGMIKRVHGAESLETFRETATGAIVAAAGNCESFTYGEERIVAILPGYDRLKTFAIIEKLRRGLPYLAQSFDCFLRPEFDLVEYDLATGVGGVIAQLVRLGQISRDVA
jgi:hypothetical protein